MCDRKARDTQRGNSARDAVRNGLSDTVLRLQPEPAKHVPVSGVFSAVIIVHLQKLKLLF